MNIVIIRLDNDNAGDIAKHVVINSSPSSAALI